MRNASKTVLGITLALTQTLSVAAGPEMDHAPWDTLLRRYVAGGLVDYRGIQQERNVLERYLAQLATTNPDTLPSTNAQVAFWINAYNACVVKGVLARYPLKSVKEVNGFFDGIRYTVGGQKLTLNEMEAKGRALGDWRVHVAFVCASSSCPRLRSEAYVPERLEAQLTDQATQFLRDASRGLRFEAAPQTLWVSKMFKWYATDFVPSGKITAENLLPLLRPSLDPTVAGALQRQHPRVRFLDYDWTLNDQDQGRTTR